MSRSRNQHYKIYKKKQLSLFPKKKYNHFRAPSENYSIYLFQFYFLNRCWELPKNQT